MTPAESAKAGPAGHAAAYGRQVRANVSVLFVQDFEPTPDWSRRRRGLKSPCIAAIHQPAVDRHSRVD
jgi:hypothetical protein